MASTWAQKKYSSNGKDLDTIITSTVVKVESKRITSRTTLIQTLSMRTLTSRIWTLARILYWSEVLSIERGFLNPTCVWKALWPKSELYSLRQIINLTKKGGLLIAHHYFEDKLMADLVSQRLIHFEFYNILEQATQ